MSKITKSSTAGNISLRIYSRLDFLLPSKPSDDFKEAVDNSMDACETASILPELIVEVVKIGIGSTKNTDLIRISVEDNGPGIDPTDIAKVFGEYLASSSLAAGSAREDSRGLVFLRRLPGRK